MRSYNGLKLFVASTFLAGVLVGCKTPVKNIVTTQSSTNYPTSVLTTPSQPATNEPKPTIESITQTYTPIKPASTSTQVTPTLHLFIDDAVVFNYGGLGRSVWEMSPDEGVEYTVKVNGVEGKCYSVNFDFENPNTKSLPEKVESKYANGIFCTSQYLSVNKWMHELFDGAKQKIGEYVTTIYNRISTPTAVPSSDGGTTNLEPTQNIETPWIPPEPTGGPGT